MSITLLIADDEGIERRALKMQLERAFPGITLLRAAENGIELVESARANRPDIVLADIEMPGMNGLSALEQLRGEGIQPHVVIMTAYSSERYLKESLSLRVFAYLEKPIHRDQVERTLRALVAEIEAEHGRNAELSKLRESIRAVRGMVRSELMTAIESDEADPNHIGELMDMLEPDARRFMVVTFSLSEPFGDGKSVYERRVAELNLFDRLRKVVRDRGWQDGHIINHRLSCLVPVMVNAPADDDYRLRYAICREVDEVIGAMDSPPGLRAGIGVATADPRLLQRCRQQSIQALYRQDRHAAICHYEDQPAQSDGESLFLTEEAALLEYIQSGNAVQTEQTLRRCFAAVPAWMPFETLRNQAFELLLSLNRKSRARLFENLLDGAAEELRRCSDREALEQYMIQTSLGSIRRKDSDDSRWQEDIIEKARQYVDACYNADISLESVAEAIGVSRFYLSRLFKTRLGMNYSAYLTDKRVRMAALLMDTQRELNNRDIAEYVGFRDPDYFGKVFKRTMGCTVSEYREKRRQEETK